MTVILKQRFPAVPATVPLARQAVRGVLCRLNLGSELRAGVALAVTEAVSNAILHAYPNDANGTVAVTVSDTPTSVTITVTDTGVGMASRTSSNGLGFGLRLIDQLATDHTVTSYPDRGTTLAMMFRTARHLSLAASSDGPSEQS